MTDAWINILHVMKTLNSVQYVTNSSNILTRVHDLVCFLSVVSIHLGSRASLSKFLNGIVLSYCQTKFSVNFFSPGNS
jgi:hypothetical protein